MYLGEVAMSRCEQCNKKTGYGSLISQNLPRIKSQRRKSPGEGAAKEKENFFGSGLGEGDKHSL